MAATESSNPNTVKEIFKDGMQHQDWLSLVAVHIDCLLLYVSSYFGARLRSNEKYVTFFHAYCFFACFWYIHV
ncbi:hypothetical protein Bca4012_000255 [Brassica carinata]